MDMVDIWTAVAIAGKAGGGGQEKVEPVTGSTPEIVAEAGTRYVCGEVTTISITPADSGVTDVLFESGTTPAILTVPNTVIWPSWFDASALSTSTIYEVSILDGVYATVGMWPAS